MELKNKIATGLALLTLVAGGCAGSPKRDEIKIYSTDKVIPNWRFCDNMKKEEKDPKAAEEILAAIEVIPDSLQYLVNEYGATVVICGKITEVKGMEERYKEKLIYEKELNDSFISIKVYENREKTWDDLPGAYYDKKILIKQNPPHRYNRDSVSRHEYGHVVLDALIWFVKKLKDKDLLKIIKKYDRDNDANKELKDGKKELTDANKELRESWAKFFDVFYSYEGHKGMLRSGLEKRIAEGARFPRGAYPAACCDNFN